MMNNDLEVSDKSLLSSTNWQKLAEDIAKYFAEENIKEAGNLFYDLQQVTGPLLLNIAKSQVSSEEDAQDAVAEAYMDLYDHLYQRKAIQHIKAFLKTVVLRRAIDIRRRQKKTEVLDDSTTAGYSAGSGSVADPYDKVETDMVFSKLTNALLDKMPSPEREILFLRHYQSLSVEETALRLGLTLDVVKKGTQKAKKIALEIATQQGIEL